MVAVLAIIFVIILITVTVRLHEKHTNGTCKSTRRLDGRTAVVTGGTAGMGLEIAREFASRGARVIVACPFPEEGLNAEKTIIQDTGNSNVIFKFLDLASLRSVRKFAKDILETEDRLDILMNNAGVGIPKDFMTDDGMSFIMQVNYFGHFLLTILLLPLLKKTGRPSEPSRIVNSSSMLHKWAIFSLDTVEYPKWFSIQSYSNSKMCFILFSRELTKKLDGSNVVINSVEPGLVGTRIYESAGKFLGVFVKYICNVCFKTAWEGAQSGLHVALDTKAGEVSGELFTNCARSRAASWAYNDDTAKKVWENSVRLVKLDKEELKICIES